MKKLCCSPLFFVNFLALSVASASGTTFYPVDDNSFAFTGRWELNLLDEKPVAKADWPCSGVQFAVTLSSSGASSSSSIALRLKLQRVLAHVQVTNTASGAVESSTILEGNSIVDFERNYEITIGNKTDDAGNYTVSVTKLTQAAPFGNGLGKLLTSVLEFHGVEMDANVTALGPAPSLPQSRRRINYIGASDTAGYCVDGTPETSDATINPWKYDNCHMASPGRLGRSFDAEISVQAIAGIGLTQNAFADTPALLGEATMPDYYNRTLQTEKQPLWNPTEWRPDLVVISLGGNDYNHQKTVPSNETFRAAYEEFLLEIAEPYMEDGASSQPPTIVSICGQGDPTEVERDPNNDRCRPCPHVKDATESFRAKHSETIRTEYIFIPCDGSVVTGDGDIGCEGHKNRLGQKRVADFLEPRLREIMGWSNETEPQVPSNGAMVMASRMLQGFYTLIGLWAAW